MRKVVIFGNSGSGKSTLAKQLVTEDKLAHLDLDTIAWLPTQPPARMPMADSEIAINKFMAANNSWVIEGCYSDLLERVLPQATEMIFMNLSIEDCIANAKNRPWEPHKYSSKAEQDANLAMLIDWIAQYDVRDDTFSKTAHQALFDNFQGEKTMVTTNQNLS